MKKIIILLGLVISIINADFKSYTASKDLLLRNPYKILDIRANKNYNESYTLNNSIHIPFFNEKNESDIKDFINKVAKEFKKDETFYLIDKTGSLSGLVAKELYNAGFKNVILLKGGLNKLKIN